MVNDGGFITATSYDDLPDNDAMYYYRATMVNLAQTEGILSEQIAAASDSAGPRAMTVQYAPHGNSDPATGRMAPGLVDVTVTLNESLMAAPFFSIVPDGGIPISVPLLKQSDQVYTGSFAITESTPTGTAFAVMSARDAVGNRGTAIDAGATIEIDTDGPTVTGLAIQPGQPIHNDALAPVSVTATFVLDQAVKGGTVPLLGYTLSQTSPGPISITNVLQVTSLSWSGTFTLPAAAGLASEHLVFLFAAPDDLDNVGSRITAENDFEVYQGDLPNLLAPSKITGDSLPDGYALLTWVPVEDAADYEIWRKFLDRRGAEWVVVARTNGELTYTDRPDTDGTYRYAVVTVRQENAEESLSDPDTTVDVVVDRVPPLSPENLQLVLAANGVAVFWDEPPGQETVTYNLYRADGVITTVDGVTPLIVGIPQPSVNAGAPDGTVVDPHPSSTQHDYTLTAVDAAGNESVPAPSQYLNVQLLPVGSLRILFNRTDPPVLSWTHPRGTGIDGFDVYLETAEATRQGRGEIKLNTSLITGLSYTDTGYAGDERRYAVVAVEGEHRSLARSIRLPRISATLPAETVVRRGVMNRLTFTLVNSSPEPIEHLRLKLDFHGARVSSDEVSVPGNGETDVDVIVGGASVLADMENFVVTLEIAPNAGELISVVRDGSVYVGDAVLPIELQNEELVRGVGGDVQFTLRNTSDVEIEIVTARGAKPSTQVRFKLLDVDGNVLSTKALNHGAGDSIFHLSNGDTVARIASGGSFQCVATDLFVPSNAPDDVVLVVEVDKIYYHRNQATQAVMEGVTSRKSLSLADTVYYGEVVSVAPVSSLGDEDVVITGRAKARQDDNPVPLVALRLGISLNGFDRVFDVFTDENGDFSHSFNPPPGEAGVYKVWLVHPDRLDKTFQRTFTINSLRVSPTTYNVRLPYNYTYKVNITVNVGAGTSVDNVLLAYDEEDQAGGVFPEGIHVTPSNPIAHLGPGQRGTLSFQIWADNSAADELSVILQVKSDSPARVPLEWKKVRVNCQFFTPQAPTQAGAEQLPNLRVTPALLITGAKLDTTTTEQLVVKSTGLAALREVRVSLVNTNGTPAPAWVTLAGDALLGDIPVGESVPVSVTFRPATGTVPEGNYSFYLRVSALNYPTTDIGLYPVVTQSGEGNTLFKVSDMYTGTLDGDGQIIEGLHGASIRIENENVSTEQYTATTDAVGEVLFSDLPAGRYKYKVTAPKHDSSIGRIWVKPGVTVTETVPLKNDLITVEWEVVPITIEDRYEIVLTATFETNVPAAVVVASPSSVQLPEMQAGDVFNTEFKLTNHGLIRADDLRVVLPSDDEFFTYEFLGTVPESLPAKEFTIVPFRVTCVKSLDVDDGRGSGSGCTTYLTCCKTTYTYKCANGDTYTNTTRSCVSRRYGDSCGGSGGGGPSGGGGGGGGGGWGGWWGWGGGGGSSGGGGTWQPPRFSPPTSTIKGTKCWPVAKKTECTTVKAGSMLGALAKMVGCSVNKLLREFQDGTTEADPIYDLTVMAFGTPVRLQRYFYNNRWHWEPLRKDLHFLAASGGTASLVSGVGREDREDVLPPEDVGRIVRDGVTYEGSTGSNIFRSGVFRIIRQDDGNWKWVDKFGNFELHDASGRIIASGMPQLTVAKYIYDGNGRLTSITDKDDRLLISLEYDGGGTLAAAEDAAGNRVAYRYTAGRLTEIDDIEGGTTSYRYNADGKINRKTDPEGRHSNVAYDSNGDVTSVLGDNGKGYTFQFDYDPARHEYYARTIDAADMVEENWYDKDGSHTRTDINGRTVETILKDGRNRIYVDEKGNRTTYLYNEFNDLTGVVYADGTSYSILYDAATHLPLRATDPRGNVTTAEYNAERLPVRTVQAEGTPIQRVAVITYNATGQVLTETLKGVSAADDVIYTYEYDALGQLTAVVDPEGNRQEFSGHNVLGSPTQRTDAIGKVWTFTFDKYGRPESATDPLAHTTSRGYDKVGNLTSLTDAFNRTWTFSYDVNDNLLGVVDPLGNSVGAEYRADSMPVRLTDEEGREQRYEYDNEGRVVREIDGAGNVIAYHYGETATTPATSAKVVRTDYPTFYKILEFDVLQRVTRTVVRDPVDDTVLRSLSFEYDANDNVTATEDGQGKRSEAEYDALNRLVLTRAADGSSTEFTYNNRDQVTAVKDANGGVSTTVFDRVGRVIRETTPEGRTTSYTYDTATDLADVYYQVTRTAPSGRKGVALLDPCGNVKSYQYYPDGVATVPGQTVEFQHDANGKMTQVTDGTTTIGCAYDELGRLAQETIDYGNGLVLTDSYTHHKNGLLASYTGPNGITYAFTYDAGNRVSGISIPGQGDVTYNSYEWDRVAAMTLPGGTARTHGYDPLMRLRELSVKDPGESPILTRSLAYAADGAVLEKNTEHGTYTYQYDDLERLVDVVNPDGDDEAYTYDTVGNRLTAAGTTGTWNYDRDNRLLDYDAGNVQLNYDDDGNMIERVTPDATFEFRYDTQGRLVEVRDGLGGQIIALYEYGPFGRRLWKEVAGVRTYFHYSRFGLAGEYAADGTELRTYGYAPGNAWSTNPLFLRESGVYYWFQNDRMGTPQKLTATSGLVVWSAVYQAFGAARVDVDIVTCNLRFPGQYFDAETGLHYNWARYYDPATGRYLSIDPLGDGINLYLYAYGDPMAYIDPWGLHGLKSVDWAGFIPVYGSLRDAYRSFKTGGFWGVVGGIANLGMAGLEAVGVGIVAKKLYTVAKVAGKGLLKSTVRKTVQRTATKKAVAKEVIEEVGERAIAKNVAGKAGSKMAKNCRPPVKVLGRLDDVNPYLNNPGYDVLRTPRWTPKLNREWVQRGIDRGQRFLLGTKPGDLKKMWNSQRNSFSVYASELTQLHYAGYRRQGNFMVPPQW